jgi:hypothetical protein
MDKRMTESQIVRKTVFEFGAWLSSRPGTLKVGSGHNCSELVEAINEWSKLIGIIKTKKIGKLHVK